MNVDKENTGVCGWWKQAKFFSTPSVLGNLAWGTFGCARSWRIHDVQISVEEIVGAVRANGAIIKAYDTIQYDWFG